MTSLEIASEILVKVFQENKKINDVAAQKNMTKEKVSDYLALGLLHEISIQWGFETELIREADKNGIKTGWIMRRLELTEDAKNLYESKSLCSLDLEKVASALFLLRSQLRTFLPGEINPLLKANQGNINQLKDEIHCNRVDQFKGGYNQKGPSDESNYISMDEFDSTWKLLRSALGKDPCVDEVFAKIDESANKAGRTLAKNWRIDLENKLRERSNKERA